MKKNKFSKIIITLLSLTALVGISVYANNGNSMPKFFGGNNNGHDNNRGNGDNRNDNHWDDDHGNDNHNDNNGRKDKLDLRIDSTQHYNGNECKLVNRSYRWVGDDPYPVPGTNCDGTWRETDLNCRNKFFNFDDIKPGDQGEDTISLHVTGDDGCGQILFKDIRDSGNTCNEPETKTTNDADCSGALPGKKEPDGELGKALEFSLWLDQGDIPGFQSRERDAKEGDNIFNGKDVMIFERKNINNFSTVQEIRKHLRQARKDSLGECEKADADGDGKKTKNGVCAGLTRDGRMLDGVVYYYGLAWELPAEVGNEVQTDSLGFDLSFQVKSNSQCSVCRNENCDRDSGCAD